METAIYGETVWVTWHELPAAGRDSAPESDGEPSRDGGTLERLLMAIVAMLEGSFPEALVRTRALISEMLPGPVT